MWDGQQVKTPTLFSYSHFILSFINAETWRSIGKKLIGMKYDEKYGEGQILTSLKKYVKDNPIVYWMDGKEITVKNFGIDAPSYPFGHGDYGDNFNCLINGRCHFDYDLGCGFQQAKPFDFECVVRVEIDKDNLIVTGIKDNRIIIKNR